MIALFGCEGKTEVIRTTVTTISEEDIQSVAGPVRTWKGEYLGGKGELLQKLAENTGDAETQWKLAKIY